MPTLFALATSVGVLAVVATWLFSVDPLASNNLQIWQAFIAWGCHFHSGGKVTGSRNTILCMSFGAVVGMAAILLAGQLGSLGALAAPVAVGLGAATICLASAMPLLAVIPASVYGFASIAGLVLLKGLTPQEALVPTILSVILGAAFGYVSEAVTNSLSAKKAPAPARQRATT
jgi:hypothetical protein